MEESNLVSVLFKLGIIDEHDQVSIAVELFFRINDEIGDWDNHGNHKQR
jgi:hypothetical protein